MGTDQPRKMIYPFVGIGGDDVHVHSDERQDLSGDRSWVLHDEVASSRVIRHMIDHKRTTTSFCAVRTERVEDVVYDSILLRDELRRIVLDELGFADEFR